MWLAALFFLADPPCSLHEAIHGFYHIASVRTESTWLKIENHFLNVSKNPKLLCKRLSEHMAHLQHSGLGETSFSLRSCKHRNTSIGTLQAVLLSQVRVPRPAGRAMLSESGHENDT